MRRGVDVECLHMLSVSMNCVFGLEDSIYLSTELKEAMLLATVPLDT
jgi:hypothetical protein